MAGASSRRRRCSSASMATEVFVEGEMEKESALGALAGGKEREAEASRAALDCGARSTGWAASPVGKAAAAGNPRPARARSGEDDDRACATCQLQDFPAKTISSSALLRILFGTKSSWNFMKIFVDIGEEYI